jgi:hypothetical protein
MNTFQNKLMFKRLYIGNVDPESARKNDRDCTLVLLSLAILGYATGNGNNPICVTTPKVTNSITTVSRQGPVL